MKTEITRGRFKAHIVTGRSYAVNQTNIDQIRPRMCGVLCRGLNSFKLSINVIYSIDTINSALISERVAIQIRFILNMTRFTFKLDPYQRQNEDVMHFLLKRAHYF